MLCLEKESFALRKKFCLEKESFAWRKKVLPRGRRFCLDTCGPP